MKKGDETKRKILDKGCDLAPKLGLEGLSIGALAAATGMSKSGLFGHFNSKQNLLISVMEHAGIVFNEEVIIPALKKERGIPRIRKVMKNWIEWTENLSGGCIFVAAAAEYSDRPGPVRDLIRKQHDSWIDCLSRIAESAVLSGEFQKDTDCELVAFELYSLIMAFYHYHSSLNYPGAGKLMSGALERLIDSYRIQVD